ncbi:hypothetical protein [Nannocystis exedens]|nr:hypothetical protein [Nannocystis exedens]
MIRLRFSCLAALLVPGPTLVGCVVEKDLDVAGGSAGGSGVHPTGSAEPGTGESTLAVGSGSTTTTSGGPDDPPTSGPTGDVEPGTTTADPTSTTTSDTSATTGDASTTTGDDAPAVLGFAADIQPIFSDYCTCHGDGQPEPDLGIGRAYDSIVGVPASDVKGMALVAPGSPEDSYLWHKVAGSQSQVGGAGKRMPPNDELQPGDLAAIEQWIADGALP